MSNRNYRLAMLISVAMTALLASCGKSDVELAAEYYQKARKCYDEGHENAALLYIDTIHSSFPKAVSVRRMADTLTWIIELEQMARSLPYLDSVMSVRQTLVPESTKNFIFVKDERYQDIGEFEHRALRTENNTQRCYLKPYTNEHGDLLLASYYVGPKVSHNVVKVSIGDTYMETFPADPSDRNGYMDLDTYHETIIFPVEKVNGITKFIADNIEEKIKITLESESGSSYSYYLNKTEKNIFVDTYRLSVLLSDIHTINRQYNMASEKASYLKTKLGYQ